MSALAAKLSVIGSLTALLPSLTVTDLRRLLAHARRLHAPGKVPTRLPVEASFWASDLLPFLAIAEHAVEARETLAFFANDADDGAADPDSTPGEIAFWRECAVYLRPLVNALVACKRPKAVRRLRASLTALAEGSPFS